MLIMLCCYTCAILLLYFLKLFLNKVILSIQKRAKTLFKVLIYQKKIPYPYVVSCRAMIPHMILKVVVTIMSGQKYTFVFDIYEMARLTLERS